MSSERRVTIGLPVHNGDRFLAAALKSLLAQDFTDFELVISDNASSDDTQEIARDFAAGDERVRYVRHEANLGAAPNFNHVFETAETPYFKWAADDDEYAPSYLSRCVEVLDSEPDVVLCHSRTVDIDETGSLLGEWEELPVLESPSAVERFRATLREGAHGCVHVFGLMRSDVLAVTPLIGSYTASDRVLLCEMALRGRIRIVDEPLFLHREHPDRSIRALPRPQDRAGWFDARNAIGVRFPLWRNLLEYLRVVDRVPLSTEDRRRCRTAIAAWASVNRVQLARQAARGLADTLVRPD